MFKFNIIIPVQNRSLQDIFSSKWIKCLKLLLITFILINDKILLNNATETELNESKTIIANLCISIEFSRSNSDLYLSIFPNSLSKYRI